MIVYDWLSVISVLTSSCSNAVSEIHYIYQRYVLFIFAESFIPFMITIFYQITIKTRESYEVTLSLSGHSSRKVLRRRLMFRAISKLCLRHRTRDIGKQSPSFLVLLWIVLLSQYDLVSHSSDQHREISHENLKPQLAS